jgi:hypothetical protein
MNFENILLEKKNSIAYVTVNRPKVLNALNMAGWYGWKSGKWIYDYADPGKPRGRESSNAVFQAGAFAATVGEKQ